MRSFLKPLSKWQTLHYDLPPESLHLACATLEANLNAVQQMGQVKLAVTNRVPSCLPADLKAVTGGNTTH